MKVNDVMTHAPQTSRPGDSIAAAVQIMWDHDCGCVPVLDEDGRLAGILTDRDACMSALHQGRPLHELLVANAMSRDVVVCRPHDAIEDAMILMRRARVRRLPVVDRERRVVGILSLNDVARAAEREARGWFSSPRLKDVGRTFAEVSRPWPRPALPARSDAAYAE